MELDRNANQVDYSRQTEPIYFNALSPYVIALAIGALFIGLGAKLEIEGLRYAGTILDLFCGGLAIAEVVVISHKHLTAINSERKQNGLPLIGKDALVIAEVEHLKAEIEWLKSQAESIESNPKVRLVETERTSKTSAHQTIKTYEDPPTLKFLETIFGTAQANGRILSEPSFGNYGRQSGWWNESQSNRWLTITDEQGITAKMFESKLDNAPRKIAADMTFALATAKFGLEIPVSLSVAAPDHA